MQTLASATIARPKASAGMRFHIGCAKSSKNVSCRYALTRIARFPFRI